MNIVININVSPEGGFIIESGTAPPEQAEAEEGAGGVGFHLDTEVADEEIEEGGDTSVFRPPSGSTKIIKLSKYRESKPR